MKGKKISNDVDGYIESYPKDVRALLKIMRQKIRKAAPQASEKISYGIPTFYLGGNLVHFGGFKDHVSFFPTSSGVKAFSKQLSKYDVSKGTVRFPLDKPLPLALITKIAKFRVKEMEVKKKKK